MTNTMQNPVWPGWETIQLIGRGSFGAVYEIQRDMLGDVEKAALKVISIPQNGSDIAEMYNDGYDDESITSTFKAHLKSIIAEYSMMRKMNDCPNIVNCDDVRYVQHDDGIGWDIFIKMELLTPVMQLPRQDDPVDATLKLGRDICNALEACRKHDIIHRDIKPQNIFVSADGDYKLGDFGIAKTVERTMGGTKIGTYKYMAPEVYNNQPYGSAADIYSLGLVLYWMLNERRLPFLPLPPEKLKAGMEDVARNKRLSGEPLPPPAHGSERLKQIVLKACAYDPKERFASAEEMKRELEVLMGVAAPVAEVPVAAAEPMVEAPVAVDKPVLIAQPRPVQVARSLQDEWVKVLDSVTGKKTKIAKTLQEEMDGYAAKKAVVMKDTDKKAGDKKPKLWPLLIIEAVICIFPAVYYTESVLTCMIYVTLAAAGLFVLASRKKGSVLSLLPLLFIPALTVTSLLYTLDLHILIALSLTMLSSLVVYFTVNGIHNKTLYIIMEIVLSLATLIIIGFDFGVELELWLIELLVLQPIISWFALKCQTTRWPAWLVKSWEMALAAALLAELNANNGHWYRLQDDAAMCTAAFTFIAAFFLVRYQDIKSRAADQASSTTITKA